MDLTSLLLFYTSGLIAQSYSSAPPPATETKPAAIDLKKKPLFCEFTGALGLNDSAIPNLEPECIPKECEVILYNDFFVEKNSKIITDENVLTRLTKLKPVILVLNRPVDSNDYDEWSASLKADGNKEEVKLLVEFAKAHPNVVGYHLRNLSPNVNEPEPLNLEVGKNIIPYIKDLKFQKDFIVGLSLCPFRPILKNTCITDCCTLNDLVDYYEYETYYMNICNPLISNSMDPIKTNPRGLTYLLSLEEATEILKESKCDREKVYYALTLDPYDTSGSRFDYSYKDVCTGKDFKSWCVENTADYFKKGVYVKDNGFGISIRLINLDDTTNSCGCGEFIILRNIVNGYIGKEQIPCPKADVVKPLT